MNEDLFFIPIIARALQGREPRESLRQAFQHIREEGGRPRYALGYRQFLEFMAAVDEARRRRGTRREGLPESLAQPARVGLVLEREGHPVAVSLPRAPGSVEVVEGIRPGRYSLRLDTGRVLWEGCLAQKDLLWADAFPRQPVEAAARTGEPKRKPTQQAALLGGALTLRVYPGVEAGLLEIEWTASKDPG